MESEGTMGPLMAIGGNLQMDSPILEEFIRRSGGADSQIVIIPTASARADGGQEFTRRFCELGVQQPPILLPVRCRAEALADQHLALVRDAGGIFFIGGDQLRLVTVLAGTPLFQAIAARYQAGAILAGTSAGAAAFGRVMIARGRSGTAARWGAAQFAEGFGFIDGVIFDQHFTQKNRLGRLIYSITVHPGSLGIGIDENTAALIEEQQLSVLGKNAVTVIDGQAILESNIDQVSPGDLFSISHLRLAQLTSGSRYDLTRREALIQRVPLESE